MSAKPLVPLLRALNDAHMAARGMANGTIAATFDQRSFADSMADDIAILVRKTKQEMMRK